MKKIPVDEYEKWYKLRGLIKAKEEERLRKSLYHPKSPFASGVKNRLQYQDYDYIEQLNEKEKLWLNKFNQEYYQDNFKDKIINRGKKRRKDSSNRNNARNRDVYNWALITGNLIQLEHIKKST